MRRVWFDPSQSPAPIRQVLTGQDAATRAAHAAATGLEWLPAEQGINLDTHYAVSDGTEWRLELRPTPPDTPPETLTRAQFWGYAEAVLGVVEADAISEIAAAQEAGALTVAEAIIARRKVTDATVYERTDPLLLEVAQLLGAAADQDDIDDHFRAAAAL